MSEEDRINIFVRSIDRSLWEQFKNVVVQQHGKLWGVLADELEKAIKLYLEDVSKQAHTHNFSGKAVKEADKVRDEILKRVQPGGSLPRNMLENMVRQTCGVVDKRSINNRIAVLVATGFLEHNWEVSMEGKVFKVIG
jgi:hypothetical protein